VAPKIATVHLTPTRVAPWASPQLSGRLADPRAGPVAAGWRAAAARGWSLSEDPPTADQLTPQELQVARLVAEGSSNKEAATALFVTPKTIETHLSHTYRKLGIRSRVELARSLAESGATKSQG
jgi:DNA-binding NarL/FixJ family response regulator